MTNMNIAVLPPEVHELMLEINHACEAGDITWEQRTTLVNIASTDLQQAVDLLNAWRR